MKQHSMRALSLLVQNFHASVLVSPRDHVTESGVALAKERLAAAEQVKECQRCGRRGRCDEPEAMRVRALTQQIDLAVLSDRPLELIPRRILTGALDKAQMNLDRVAWVAVNACAAKGAATLDEQAACYQNVLTQLHASHARYVLLAGAKAKSSWRYDLPLAKVAGRIGLWDSRWFVCPVLGPADLLYAGSRGDKTLIREWETQVVRFALAVHDDVGALGFSETCVTCGEYMQIYDPDGMPWCSRHAAKGLDGALKSKTKWHTADQPPLDI